MSGIMGMQLQVCHNVRSSVYHIYISGSVYGDDSCSSTTKNTLDLFTMYLCSGCNLCETLELETSHCWISYPYENSDTYSHPDIFFLI